VHRNSFVHRLENQRRKSKQGMGIVENEKEKRRIIEDIEKSGYPLEIKSTLILESMNWHVLNQEGYLDIETAKWRSIDILAHKNLDVPNSSIYERLHVSLVIECKKSSKPWMFWIRDKGESRIFHPIVASGLIKLESKPWLHPLHFEKFVDCFHYYFPQFKKVAIVPYEPFIKEEAGKSAVFEAKNQVLKSLLYEREQIRRLFSMEDARQKAGVISRLSTPLSVFCPVIIFDGHLYELEYVHDKPEPSLSKYVQYLTSYGLPTPEGFVIDIVEIGFLREYLGVLDDEMKIFAKRIASLQSPSEPPVERS